MIAHLGSQFLRQRLEKLTLEPHKFAFGLISIPGINVEQPNVDETDFVQHQAIFRECGRMIGNCLQLDEIEHIGTERIRALGPVARSQPTAWLKNPAHVFQEWAFFRNVQPRILAKDDIESAIGEGQRSGRLVAELTAVSKSFGAKAIVRDLDFIVSRGDRIGLAMACRAMARAAHVAGRPDAAQRQLAGAYRVARGRDSAHELAVTQLAEAEFAAADGAAARARQLIDQAAAAFDTMAMDWHLAQALQLRERL